MTVGIVVIGRNEGGRLIRCLESLAGFGERCVYVDSGSTDSSTAEARSRGIEVLDLDMSMPFTAARARNAGFRQLVKIAPSIDKVHFIDGDCEVVQGWLFHAEQFMDERREVGVVFGLQKERFPGASVYNRLMDIEWATPIGEALASTGNALIRRSVFEKVGGFRDDLIAGEDPELCLRIRQAGYLVWHLDREMVWHDADIRSFGQWWKRAKRGGYAFAEGAALHGAGDFRHFRREARSICIWGIGLPVLILASAIVMGPLALLLLLIYPLQIARMTMKSLLPHPWAFTYSAFMVLAKFPEAAGLLKYLRDRAFGSRKELIEYK
ncbi:MAG: glycosyltransferase family 2 protein [Steroidobacteraceae bacterium]